MAVEAELKRDHAEMQGVIEAKQKIIDAQVHTGSHTQGRFTLLVIIILDTSLKLALTKQTEDNEGQH